MNIVIIGAGPAGLAAAFELARAKAGHTVTVLEKSSALGGISRTVEYHGNRMDIGGHRFFSKNQKVMDWWAARMPLAGDPEKEDNVMLVRHRMSHILFNRRFFEYPLRLKPATFFSMGFRTSLDAGLSYCAACLRKRLEQSLEDFFINRFGKKLYSIFFESYTEKVWGRHPSQMSPDWGAQRVRGLSLTKLLSDSVKHFAGLKRKENTETSLIENFWYPKFGPGQLWEHVAQEIQSMGGRVLRNHCVTKIHCKEKTVIGVTANGELFPADCVISSLPLSELVPALDTEIPDEISAIAKGLLYRDFISVGILVRRLFFPNQTDNWIYVQDPDIRAGRLQIFNNWSPYMVKDPENTVWIGLEYFCNEGDMLWSLSDRELVDFAKQELVSLKAVDKNDIMDGVCERTKKAYPGYFGTYKQLPRLTDWLLDINHLYCVGRNGQHRYNNMDHSMLTSFLTVEHILGQKDKKSKAAIWHVNADTEYHEEKHNT